MHPDGLHESKYLYNGYEDPKYVKTLEEKTDVTKVGGTRIKTGISGRNWTGSCRQPCQNFN